MTLQEVLQKLFVYQSHGLGAVRRPLSEQEAVACAAEKPCCAARTLRIGTRGPGPTPITCSPCCWRRCCATVWTRGD